MAREGLLADFVALIDDDAPVRLALTFSLEAGGYAVDAFGDGESALASSSGPARWRCLIVDYRLPGLSGLDVLEQLRERQWQAPGVLITSWPTQATCARAARVGVPVLEKPILDDALLRWVQRAMS